MSCKWDLIRFGDLYEIESRNGLSKPSKIRGTGFKMINMGELFANDRIYDIEMECVPLKENEKNNAKIEVGDLLFARQSLVLEGAGKCSIVLETSELTVFESHLIRVRLRQDKAYPMFYYYYFKSSLSPIKTIVSQCAQAGIRGSELQELDVIYPEMKKQIKIADMLSKYDDLIENNQKQIKLLEETAQRLYKEWFVDLKFPNYEECKIVDGIPEGWRKVTLGDICVLRKETLKPEKIKKGIPYIGLEHMPRKDICLAEWGDSSDVNSNKFQCYENDVIFGKIRPYFHKVGYALVNCICSTDAIIMVAQEGIWGLLLLITSSVPFVDYTYKTCKEGAKMPRADWNMMKKYPVLVAAGGIQKEFERNIWSITRRIKSLAMQNRKLTEIRERLLPKLMSKEIEI